jgi:hypothetical protein
MNFDSQTKTAKEVKMPIVLPPVKPKPPKPKPLHRVHNHKTTKTPVEQLNELLVTDAVSVTEPPPVLEAITKPKELHSVEQKLNTAEVVSQVHQVAPRLPIKASSGAFKSLLWNRLIPNKFRSVQSIAFMK